MDTAEVAALHTQLQQAAVARRRRLRFPDVLALIQQWQASHGGVFYDVLVENQRGVNVLGAPLYLANLLLPVIDPGPFQAVTGARVLIPHHNLEHYHLPDPTWHWGWDEWYVLMLDDVDDQGWVYARMFFLLRWGLWKGRYYHGNFIRRRLWVRKRVKAPECMARISPD